MLVYIEPLSMFPKLHSDKLFGAILATMSEIFPNKIDETINYFKNNNPPFLISSSFPVIKINNNKIRFLPKLILKDKFDSSINQNIKKDFKKVDFIEEKIFFDIIRSKLSQSQILENYYDEYTRINNLLMRGNHDINMEFTKSTIRPHNSINRLSNRTKIFYNEGDFYQKNCAGLFFYVEVFNNSYNHIIISCLKFLEDRGFGKDISTGNGQFKFSVEESNIFNFGNSIDDGDKFVTLSRFIPTEDDLKFINEESCYELDSKRSIGRNGDVRKQIHFFKEGSTFSYYKKFYGKIVDVGNYKPAIEFGYAFPIKY